MEERRKRHLARKAEAKHLISLIEWEKDVLKSEQEAERLKRLQDPKVQKEIETCKEQIAKFETEINAYKRKYFDPERNYLAEAAEGLSRLFFLLPHSFLFFPSLTLPSPFSFSLLSVSSL